MKKFAFVVALFAVPAFATASFASTAFADEAAGKKAFEGKCAACHGKDGKGKTKQGEKMKIGDMTSAAWKKEFGADKIKSTIETGFTREKDGVKQEMKPVKGLAPDVLESLVKHVQGLK